MRFLAVPEAIIGQDGRLEGLRCLRAEMVAQEGSNRMRPVPVKGSDFVIEADAVIPAIGQQVDTEGIAQLKGLDWTRRSTIDTNMVSMETSLPGVFAVGDAVTGPATVIEAIGAGKRAAARALAEARAASSVSTPYVPYIVGQPENDGQTAGDGVIEH